MKLSEHFQLSEFTRSDTATAHGLTNTPPPEVARRLGMLCHMVLEPTRARVGAPIHISSGYRSIVVNQLAGGVPTSQHCKGEAADIWTGAMDAESLMDTIRKTVPEWDQLYCNRDQGFVHVSYRVGNNRKQILPTVG